MRPGPARPGCRNLSADGSLIRLKSAIAFHGAAQEKRLPY